MATADILPGEPVCEVPAALLLSAPAARGSEIGHVFEENPALFAAEDDRVLVVFLMYERLKGPRSFWAPWLATMPEPTSIELWSPSELSELQVRAPHGDMHSRMGTAVDKCISECARRRCRTPRSRARRRRASRGPVSASVTSLAPSRRGACARCACVLPLWAALAIYAYLYVPRGRACRYPALFPATACTYEAWRWAWLTVQTRAFGRRLPWSALVPFVDTLNHANVATMYDFDAGGNGRFRMFPSGENRFVAGSEIFNSYGKRDNRHLMLEYVHVT